MVLLVRDGGRRWNSMSKNGMNIQRSGNAIANAPKGGEGGKKPGAQKGGDLRTGKK